MSALAGRIDHVASAERLVRELLLVCPDPNVPDFEGHEEEFRMNVALRSALNEAMEIIEISTSARQIQAEADDGTKNPVVEGIKVGMRAGEEAAAKRIISRLVGAFDAV